MISIDSKYSNLVHVWELSNHQHKYSQCVEEEHWILIVCCVRGDQIPANETLGEQKMGFLGKRNSGNDCRRYCQTK